LVWAIRQRFRSWRRSFTPRWRRRETCSHRTSPVTRLVSANSVMSQRMVWRAFDVYTGVRHFPPVPPRFPTDGHQSSLQVASRLPFGPSSGFPCLLEDFRHVNNTGRFLLPSVRQLTPQVVWLSKTQTRQQC
jgi:hypothetical protein